MISELHNGDEVVIALSDGQTPPAAWESVVVTGKARAAIRRATRDAVRAQYSGLGREIVERAFKRAGRNFTEAKLKAALPRLARSSLEEVFVAVGRGEMFSGDVVRAVHPDFKDERAAGPAPAQGDSGWFGLNKAAGLMFKAPGKGGDADSAIPIRGLRGDLPVRFAPKGGAVPGERIIGILTPERGSPSIPSIRPRSPPSTTGRSFGSTCDGTSILSARSSIRRKSW